MTWKTESVYAVLLFFTLGVIVSGSTTDICNAAEGNGAWMGDGDCDPHNLISECDWDGGDCCRCTCSDETFVCGTDGYFCVDPDVLNDELTNCPEIMPPLCPGAFQTKWVVENTTQVQALAEAVNCSGGSFEVGWKGTIVVATEIVIQNRTSLRIFGMGSDAVVDGGGNTRLFRVVNASLQLSNLEIRNGSATFGGAIAAMASTLNISRSNFTGNTANVKNGGAVFVYGGSNVSFSGESGFFNNTSNYDGGALYVVSSSVSWGGVSSFSGNSASLSGGALCAVVDSTVSWAAETTFRGNSADNYQGGALFLEGGIHALWTADAYFIDNRAQSEGGAIFVNLESDASWSQGVFFSGNTATFNGGGAIFIEYSSNVGLNGVTTFQSNSCGAEGGAVSSRALESSISVNSNNQDSSLTINGTATFAKNKCQSNGGGLAVLEGLSVIIMKKGNITFVENEAVVAGGGVFISSLGEGPTFTNASFMFNYAEVGGGIFITGSGTSLEPGDGELSATFEECRFIGNKAEATGGAIESATGATAITNTYFKGNEAAVGGALRLAGASSVQGCTFEDNISDLDGGQAVSWIGYNLLIDNCSFRDNSYDCDDGTVAHDEPGDRFAAVCSGCDDCEDCFVEREGIVPTCTEMMEHSTRPNGTYVTLETLLIDAGYWRATNGSIIVLACYNKDACQGGLTGSNDFCKKGYKGPYCVVCDDRYVKGPRFTCAKCSENVWGIASAVMCSIAAVVTTVLVIKYVISADDVGAGRGIYARFLRRVPLQPVKIIIVAWQILAQFTEVENVFYPETYKAFLDVLNFINIDLWVLSVGCMTYIDFHLRFLAVTVGPIVAMLVLGGTYFYAARRHDASSDESLKIVRQKHMTVVLFILFFVYTSASSVILPMFDCDALDDGNVYLRVDYTIHCDGLKHRVLMAFAGIMFLLYPLGIPVFFTYLLLKNRRMLLNETLRENSFNVNLFSDLWKPYRPSRFYYEVIECVRRLVLIIVSIIIEGDSAAQVAVTIMFAVFFAMISEGLAPYESKLDAWISRFGHGVVVLSMYFALLLKVHVSNDSQASQKVFELALIASHLLMVLATIIEAILTGCSLNKRQVEHPLPRQNIYRPQRFRTVPL